MDRELDFLIPDFPEININPIVISENVPEIEIQTRVIKERLRSISIKLPFQRLPEGIIIKMMKFVIMWINTFPVKISASTTYIPQTIMTGTGLYWTKNCKAEFGAYCEVHEENSPMKKNQIDYAHTCSTIYLGPTSNFRWNYTFFCINTGKRICRKQFSVVPMPDSVVK